MARKLKKTKFSQFLGIISILGFLAIIYSAIFGVSITEWVNGLLFVIIGFGIFVVSGAKFFAYFKDGLTTKEFFRVIAVIIGLSSVFTGLLMLPIFGFDIVVLNGVKIIISLIAISVILAEEFLK